MRYREYVLIPLVALAMAGCTERGEDVAYGAAARVVDEGCGLGASPLGMEGRMKAVDEINERTTVGNYTASDCDLDGLPDFDIGPDGMVVR